MTNKLFKKAQLLLPVFVLLATSAAFAATAFASTLTQSTVLLYNMNAGGTSKVAVAFTTASAGATSVSIDFNGWTGGAAGIVNATQTVDTTGCTSVTGATTALPGSLTAAGSGSTVTISGVTALSASTSYCAILTSTSAVTNPTTPGTSLVTLTAGSDTRTLSVDVISDDTVNVSATVPPSFTMALSANTDTFASNLSTASTVGTSGITATVNTNAAFGWSLWGSDSNTGLKSASNNYTVPSTTPGTNATLTNGAEGYVTGISGITQGSGSGGTTSASTPYNSSGSGNGSGLDSTQRMLASSTGTANGAAVTLKEYSTIKGTTPAGADYSDTITLVGAGSF